MFLNSRHGKKNKSKYQSSFSPSPTQQSLLWYIIAVLWHRLFEMLLFICVPSETMTVQCFPGQILPNNVPFFNALIKKIHVCILYVYLKQYVCFTKIVQSWGVVIFHPNETTSNTQTFAKFEAYRSIVLTKSESLANAGHLLDVFRRQMSTKKSETSLSRVGKKQDKHI